MCFIVPVIYKNSPYTAVIIAEVFGSKISFNKTPATLYEIFDCKIKTARPDYANLKSSGLGKKSPINYTLLEILGSVKDLSGIPYVVDGHLNYYLLNEGKGNYFQKTGKYTGKKDLIAYHNISQDNLDKAIQLGGLAVSSIAITKKETDFSNFGNITLLMPQDVVNPKETPVYTWDAWTGVFPGMVRTPKKKKLTDYISKTILPLQKEIPRSVMDYGELYTPSRIETASASEGEKRVESFLESDGAKYLYLKSIGKEPKIKRKTAGFGTYSEFTIYPRIRKAFDGLSKKYKLEEEV